MCWVEFRGHFVIGYSIASFFLQVHFVVELVVENFVQGSLNLTYNYRGLMTGINLPPTASIEMNASSECGSGGKNIIGK